MLIPYAFSYLFLGMVTYVLYKGFVTLEKGDVPLVFGDLVPVIPVVIFFPLFLIMIIWGLFDKGSDY